MPEATMKLTAGGLTFTSNILGGGVAGGIRRRVLTRGLDGFEGFETFEGKVGRGGPMVTAILID